MTLPADLSTFTLKAQYMDFQGNPKASNGTHNDLIVTYPVIVSDPAHHVVLVPHPINLEFDETGFTSAVIPVTKDPDVVPTNFTLTVKENFAGGRILTFEVPDGADTIWIDQFTSSGTVPPSTGTTVYATFAALQSETSTRSDADTVLGQRLDVIETITDALGTTFVSLTGNQTIEGIKTYTDIPALPDVDPTTINQSVRKSYVDRVVATAIATAMLLTGIQTVAGVKTFNSFPVGPSSAPTSDYQFANKKFVDDSVAAAGGGATVTPGVIVSNLIGDGVTLGTANCTSGSAVVTLSSGHPFTSEDVTKNVLIYQADSDSVCTFVGHIVSVNSDNSITVDRPVTTSASNTMLCYGTDETAVFQADVDRAATYALLHGGRTKLQVPGTLGDHFVIAGPLRHDRQGNDQVMSPVWGTTGPAFVCAVKGVSDGSSTQHWETILPNVGGSTFVSYFSYASSSAQTTDINNFGHSAMFGGPTEPSGYTQSAKFNNVQFTFENIQIRTTHTRDGIGIGALNLASCKSGGVASFGWGSMSTVVQHIDSVGNYGNGLVVGLILPAPGNNDLSFMSNATCHGGYTYDVWISEHTDLYSVRLLYGWAGLCVVGNYWGSVGTTHGVNGFLSVEGCSYFLYLIGAGSGGNGPYLHLTIDTEGTLKIGDNNGGLASLSVTGQVYLMGEIDQATFSTDNPIGFDVVLAINWYPNKGVSANWTVDTFTKLVVVDATAGDITINLPTADGRSKPVTVVLGATAGGHNCTVKPTGSETINGETEMVLGALWNRGRYEPYAHNWVQTA